MSDSAPAVNAAPIALVVIGGYLGAGKTTLLNYVLSHAQDRRVAVLVNDFGAINIDASLIRSRTDDVIQLENGCICCSIGGRLVEALTQISARADRPELLIIEASGVSDPMKIAQIGLLDRAFRLCGVIVAADAERIDATLLDPYVGNIARRQIEAATALVLTKVDLISARQKADVAQRMAALAPNALLVESVNGQMPLGLIFDASVVPRNTGHHWGQPARWQANEHASISSITFRCQERLDKNRLKQTLRQLPPGLLRAKGIVWLDNEPSPHELHVVGNRILLTPFAGSAAAESIIVCIGRFTDDSENAARACLARACAVAPV